jgi:hypothetical protein
MALQGVRRGRVGRLWQQIADELGVDQKTISTWLGETAGLPEFLEPPESRQHFDIWQFQSSNGNTSYFGAMPGTGPDRSGTSDPGTSIRIA